MKKERGFTLFEVVLVIGLLFAVFFLGLNIVTMPQKVTAKQGAKTVEQILQNAARRAREGVKGTSWGVYVPYNETSRRASQAIVFSGVSYASRTVSQDVVYPISEYVAFTSFKNNPASVGNDHEIVFDYLSGETAAASSLVLDFSGGSLELSFSSSGLPISDPL